MMIHGDDGARNRSHCATNAEFDLMIVMIHGDDGASKSFFPMQQMLNVS